MLMITLKIIISYNKGLNEISMITTAPIGTWNFPPFKEMMAGRPTDKPTDMTDRQT